MDARLPAHLEVAALIRRVQHAGGFAAVLRKGERETGTLLVALVERGADARVFERMPRADGERRWECARSERDSGSEALAEYLARRVRQDPDLWIVELDVAEGERFIR